MHKEQLITISSGIINSDSNQDEVKYTKLLSAFFSNFKIYDDPYFQQNNKTEISTQGGIAISFSEAANCINDYLRTARYIKASYLAIKELLKRFPNEKIQILYAGCGPYATLLLPVLPFFSEKQVEIVLLDINEYAVESIKKLVSILDLNQYIADFVKGDAVTYTHVRERSLHLVLTETMFHALVREPQFAVTANLASQLVKNGIFLPEEISIHLVCTFFGKEPYLKDTFDAFNTLNLPEKNFKREPARVKLATLFSLNRDTDFLGLITKPFQIESAYYDIPKEYSTCPDLCLLTNIHVFQHIELNNAESFITNPYCITSIHTLTGYSYFKLIYDFKNNPTWTYQLKE